MPKRLMFFMGLVLTALWQVPSAWAVLRSESLIPEAVSPCEWIQHLARQQR